MKKNIVYLMIILAIFVLPGCKKKDMQTDFMPTPTVAPKPVEGDNSDEVSEDVVNDSGEPVENNQDEPVYTGKTVTKFAKLDDYDAILNVRSTPSKDGEIVGFLVHTEQIEVISIENGWASFVYKNEVRYVSEDFLTDKKPSYITPPTPTPTPKPTKAQSPESTQDINLSDAPPEI
ncbi:MAG TPA: SH3 domain-containing protein [Mobilitalea sp.]|nr:SH3 domain-containing protein [Mobilitalea sp.]